MERLRENKHPTPEQTEFIKLWQRKNSGEFIDEDKYKKLIEDVKKHFNVLE